MEALTKIVPWLPYLAVVLATAAVVEASKRVYRRLLEVDGKARQILDAVLPVLPEVLCGVACVVAPIVPWTGSHWVVRLAVGILGGSLASKLYMVIGKRVIQLVELAGDRVASQVGGK